MQNHIPKVVKIKSYLEAYWKEIDNTISTKFPNSDHIFPDIFLAHDIVEFLFLAFSVFAL